MMSLYTLKKEIARHIVLSQIASDGGKGIYELEIAHSYHVAKAGYAQKDSHIACAIQLIDNSKGQSGFYYYCTKTDDQNGNPSKLIYFTWKVNGKRYQCSFHTFCGGFIKKKAAKNSGLKVHWDRKVSREACETLIKEYSL